MVIPTDPRISRGKATKRAWHESGHTAFFCGDGFAPRKFWVHASEVAPLSPQIVLKARECARGTGFVPLPQREDDRDLYPGRANSVAAKASRTSSRQEVWK